MGYQTKISNLKTRIKQLSIFTIALILSATSLATFIAPQANATTLPNVVADPGFNVGSGVDSGTLWSVSTQPDGKIIVGGGFTTFNGNTQNRLVRLNQDGTIDNSFNIGSGFGDSYVRVVAMQSDNKILVGGRFTSFDGNIQNSFIRLNPNGSKDTSFNIGSGFNDVVRSIIIQPDGKIIVGGGFTTFNGNTQNRLVRLNQDGTIDNSFNIGSGFNAAIEQSTGLQPDGKIIVGGGFTTFNGNTQNRLVRLNQDGTIDNSFNIGSGFDNLTRAMNLLPDGRIIIAGNFTTFDGVSQKLLIRLNPDGSKDNSFNIGSGFSNGSLAGQIVTTTLMSDGRIILGGNFTAFNGNTQNSLVRLNVDGTKDTSFDIGDGFNPAVWSTTINLDDDILAGGSFTTYQNQPHNRLIRLILTPDRDADGLLDTQEDSSPNSGDANQDGTLDSLQNNVTSYINPITNQTTVLEVDSQCSLSNISTKDMSTNPTQDTNYSYPLGLYDFTASCGTPGYTTSFKAHYYNADTTKNYTLRKYNPNTNTYTTIDNATFTTETIASQPVLTATYLVTDGSSLDTDGLVNGIIVDPAGPALASTTTTNSTNNTNTPTAPNTGVGLSSDSNRQATIQTQLTAFIILNTIITAVIYTYKNRKQNYDHQKTI